MANEPEADPERDQRTVFAYQVIDVNLITLLIGSPHHYAWFCVSMIVSIDCRSVEIFLL